MKWNKKFFNDRGFLSTVAIVLSLVVAVALVFTFISDKEDAVLSYSDFVKTAEGRSVAAGSEISDVLIQKDNIVAGKLKNGTRFTCRIILTEELLSKLVHSGANVNFEDSSGGSWALNLLLFMVIGFLALLIYMAFSFFRGFPGGQGGGGGKIFGMGKSRARMYPADAVKTKFSDVAGLVEVKDELTDVVNFLKNPDKFKEIGAKIPRGVLLEGDPGNGKTLLARAIAGEAGCPFLTISGSDFVEMFVGVGASRVRELFAQARKHVPCIIFIDEIDAVGKQRHVGPGGGNEERDQTLNQLLAEMDGFATEPGEIIVLAATNRSDVLDKALLRPGRFDKVVTVPYPDVRARLQILRLHSKNIKMDSSIDLDRVARGTSGSSGAELANLLNEAALIAVKDERKAINMFDLEGARDKMLLGAEKKSIVRTPEELRETAYHEGGHALMNLLLPNTDPFHKVTIVARGHALGVSFSIPEADVHSKNKEELFSRIIVALGGLIAERLILNTQTTGVSSDLKAATGVARSMVVHYGMSDLGHMSLGGADYSGRPSFSEATAEEVDKAVKDILDRAYLEGERLMKENMSRLELLAQALLEKETLDAAEAYQLLGIKPRVIHSLTGPDKSVVSKGESSVDSGSGASSGSGQGDGCGEDGTPCGDKNSEDPGKSDD